MWDLPRKASIGPSNGFSAAASVGTKLAQMIKPAKKGVQYFNMASSSIAVFILSMCLRWDCCLSLSLSARLLSWILRNYRDSVLALLIGLMIGSLRVIWPWPNGVGVISSEENEVIEGSTLAWPDSFSAFIWPVIFGLAGFIIVIFIWNLSRSDQ